MSSQFRALERKSASHDDSEELARELIRMQDGVAKYHESVSTKFDGIDARFLDIEQKLYRNGGRATYASTASNPFNSIAEHEGFKSLQRGGVNTGRILIEGGVKSLLSLPVAPSYGRVATPFQRPIRVFDYMPRVPNTTGTAQYVQLSGPNTAAVQSAPGALKAEASVTAQLLSTEIPTIAVWQQVPKQSLADLPSLLPRISQLFMYFVMEQAEVETIATLLAGATSFTPTATNPVDTISEAEASLKAIGANASVAIVNPQRLHLLRTTRGSDGHLLQGWFEAGDPPKAWNVPLLASSAVAVDEVLMFDSNAVELNDREQATVLISTEDRDNFVRNLATVLAEIRIASTVIVPAGVRKFTLPE